MRCGHGAFGVGRLDQRGVDLECGSLILPSWAGLRLAASRSERRRKQGQRLKARPARWPESARENSAPLPFPCREWRPGSRSRRGLGAAKAATGALAEQPSRGGWAAGNPAWEGRQP